MEDAARVHAQGQRTGEVKLTVTNSDQATEGWTASIDDGPALSYVGRAAIVRNVQPGKRVVRIRGTIGGRQRTARKTINAAAGGATAVELAFP